MLYGWIWEQLSMTSAPQSLLDSSTLYLPHDNFANQRDNYQQTEQATDYMLVILAITSSFKIVEGLMFRRCGNYDVSAHLNQIPCASAFEVHTHTPQFR
uniref:Uncharacterized protein n=1 Tax=Tanacetum cinerariifolium TaxID=118510 RepID=A0A699HLF6_TANCI|nr:hypothetical protein [Tanacetum cinerariifolium]